MAESNQKIMIAHPNANSLITGSMIPKNSAIKVMPKILSFKLVKPQTPNISAVTHTTDLTQYLTTVPLMNKMSPSSIQLHESPSITATSSTQHTDTIMSSLDFSIVNSDSSTVMKKELMTDNEKENDSVFNSVFNSDSHFIWSHKSMLFFSEYEEHEKKFQKRRYQSKEAMFQALAESFQKKGYINATKNHMKNKFKLLKKKWDIHIKRTTGKNSSGKGTKPLPYEEEMIKIFEKSHSGVPLIVASRNGIMSKRNFAKRLSKFV
ncbi:uncharacterized protein LOC112588850 isoform X1 [Harpegnathos saltator]|uniref:uncharacterized protein LOC112588850 isoform X1 n=1 Tax=Harpegnathos saltator TaxID=610380 RepID=UPI000DBED1C1|nr:uncharacterized protein LOC112588850 isoform X1 [Harpegnathos saltator]XP_025155813.1 uncharacterized protein LOC112588850 isoform X1 [Harpegnathos saltator]